MAIFLTFLSGVLTVCAFPKINFFLLSFICLIPLIRTFEKTRSPKILFFHGILFGFVFLGIFHQWFFEVRTWVAIPWIVLLWTIYMVYLGLFYGISFFLIGLMKQQTKFWIFAIAPLWTIFEWLRSLGRIGNPAGALGYSQSFNGPLLQMSSITGVFGLSFIIVLINTLIYLLIFHPRKKFLNIAGLTIILGSIAVHQNFLVPKLIKKNGIKIAVIQPNDRQIEKLDPKFWEEFRSNYLKLTQQAINDYHPDLIFWPETMLPTLNLANSQFMNLITGIIREGNSHLLFGTPIERQSRYYNSVALITPDGISDQTYDKILLMPFGEYIPWRQYLEKIGPKFFSQSADYTSGKHRQDLIQFGALKIGNGICLEGIYPNFFRRVTQQGADFLAVYANNAWFYDSAAADEHFQMCLFRAVENRRYLVIAANTGISAIIDPFGTTEFLGNLNEPHRLFGKIYSGFPISFYTRFGNWVIGASLILIFILGIFERLVIKDRQR